MLYHWHNSSSKIKEGYFIWTEWVTVPSICSCITQPVCCTSDVTVCSEYGERAKWTPGVSLSAFVNTQVRYRSFSTDWIKLRCYNNWWSTETGFSTMLIFRGKVGRYIMLVSQCFSFCTDKIEQFNNNTNNKYKTTLLTIYWINQHRKTFENKKSASSLFSTYYF